MQRKWLLDFEVKEARKISKAKAPQRNKNQERDGGERQIQVRTLTEEDREQARSYSVLMPLAARSVKKLDDLLHKAVTKDSRSTGIGSYGGHIARERRLPGPLNGKEVHVQGNGCATSPFYVKLKKKKQRPPIESPDDMNPTWNKNFVNDHHDRERGAKEQRDEQCSLVKSEMQTFLNQKNLGPEHVQRDDSTTLPEHKYTFPKHLPDEVVDEWSEMLVELSRVSEEVNSNDLMEISSWVKPPAAAVDILGYMSVLLGINPDWSTIKRLLLRNIPALLNFIHKIEPRQIPLERIILASEWREEHIPVLSHLGIAKVNKALSKLTRWVLQFNRMITFFLCATEDDIDSASNSVLTVVKEKKMIEKRKKDSEKLSKSSGSKNKLLARSGSKAEVLRGDSKRNLNRGTSRRALGRGESLKEMRSGSFTEADHNNVNMHELITRNASASFSRDNEENIPAMSEIDFASAAKEYEAEHSRPPSRDPILGRRRVSVVSQILQKDSRRGSVKEDKAQTGEYASDHSKTNSAAFDDAEEDNDFEAVVEVHPKGVAQVHTGQNFEAQFWKSIGAAFMLDDKGQIILSNGKDIALYQDMLLGDETVTSDYSRQKLSGSDLALTTRRRKIVAANRDLIHNYVGTLIKQASNEYTSHN